MELFRAVIWQKKDDHLNLIILSNPFKFTLVFIYFFFDVVHFWTQGNGMVNLQKSQKYKYI